MTNIPLRKKLNAIEKNNQQNVDTIAAIATAPGMGGVGIVRVSGPLTSEIAQQILGLIPPPRYATFAKFAHKNQQIDEGLALYFPNPNSFTGEDVLEFQGHGGPIVLDSLLKAILDCGARLAEPGEFSKRAFLNNKIDLTQAEAIADLISAHSEQAAKSALNSLQGEFKNKINSIVDKLIQIRKFVEAAIDFPEEEIDFLADENLKIQLRDITHDINVLENSAKQGAILRNGINVVIAGSPNAGKSSLLNALSQRESAIVTDIPGTTRDVLREWINLNGVPLHIIDTAGLHETQDTIEQEGIKRAFSEIKNADLILYVVDATRENAAEFAHEHIAGLRKELDISIPALIVFNKMDLIQNKKILNSTNDFLIISAKNSAGVDNLRDYLLKFIGWQNASDDIFIARRRHLDAIKIAKQFIQAGIQQFYNTGAGELLAEDLRLAQHNLNSITGEFTSDDLLGKIFSEFCIGK